jgi:hypothetical protein
MSMLHRVVLPVLAVAGFGFLVACGNNTKNNVPPPSGGFSDTDFNGTYTFSIAGNDNSVTVQSSLGPTSSLGAYSAAGTITACGCSKGQITAGTVDLFDVGPTIAVSAAVQPAGSSYSINASGIGTMTLALGNQAPPLTFTFVLTDAAHGLITEYDQSFAGSGTIDLQPNPVTLSNSSYAFSVSGGTMVSGSTTGTSTTNPVAAVGAFTLDSSGAITAGLADINDGGSPATGLGLTGSVSAGSGTTPGTATFSFSGVGTLTFDVFAIDATHLKLIEKGGPVVLVGDLFSQPSPRMPSASLAFTMASLNIPALSASAGGFGGGGVPPSVAVGGTVSSDGSANLTSGAEDVNSSGTLNSAPASFTGTFGLNPSGNANGRFQLVLSGFTGGTNFVAYPSSGGVLLLEDDSGGTLSQGGIMAGAAIPQNSPAGLVASQGYAINLTGADLFNATELDQVGQFNTTGSKLSGTIYQNDFNIGLNSYGIGGSSNFTSGATGQVVLNFNGGNSGVLYYGVDGVTSLALGADTSDVSLGVIQMQGSPTSTAGVAVRHLAMMKAAALARARATKQKKHL